MDKLKLKRPDGTDYPVGKNLKIKDIIIPEPKTSHKAGEASDEGDYIFFTNGEAIKHFNDFDFEGEYIIANTGGRAAFTYVNDKFATSSDCFVFKTNENTKYISLLLAYNLDKINRTTFRGNGLKHLDKKYFNNLEFYIPCLEEQAEIVKLLEPVEKQLKEEKNIIESLKEFKYGMIQRMFPQKGSKVPEIRFAGFSDDWEQRKFGEVFDEYSEKHHEELEPLTIIQGKGTILRTESERNLKYDKSGLVNYKLVNKDDFILHLRSFEGGLEVSNSQGIVSPAYHIFHGEETDSRFYYPFFRSNYFINVLLKPHVYGIRDGKSIDVEGMKEMMIPYPKYEEQKAMGEYFSILDRLITLHQRKLIQLELLNKGLMQSLIA